MHARMLSASNCVQAFLPFPISCFNPYQLLRGLLDVALRASYLFVAALHETYVSTILLSITFFSWFLLLYIPDDPLQSPRIRRAADDT